jgi:hypothetical protein
MRWVDTNTTVIVIGNRDFSGSIRVLVSRQTVADREVLAEAEGPGADLLLGNHARFRMITDGDISVNLVAERLRTEFWGAAVSLAVETYLINKMTNAIKQVVLPRSL